MKDFNSIIGNNLKNIRNQKQLSLDNVAELTGVSKGMLAQIEKGASNPTVTVLWKIAKGLNVSFSYFMEEPNDELKVVSKASITPIIAEQGGMKVFPIFPFDKTRKFEVFIVTLDKGITHQSEAHAQGVEESIIMTKGKISLTVGEKQIHLFEGDSVRYKADVPHEYSNYSEAEAEFQQIIFYKN